MFVAVGHITLATQRFVADLNLDSQMLRMQGMFAYQSIL